MNSGRGRREREARKRHRRAVISYDNGAGCVTLKLGHKKIRTHIRLFMADSERHKKQPRSTHSN